MVPIDPQLTAGDVLRAFHHDWPSLFLGSAFITVGAVSAAFCVLRRRYDALLVWMAVFAVLYGLRMWLYAHLLRIEPNVPVFIGRLRAASEFLVPVPAYYFFRAVGILNKGGKALLVGAPVLALAMTAATLIFGPLPFIGTVNAAIIVGVLWLLVARTLSSEAKKDRDFTVIRRGVLVFAIVALSDNLVTANWSLKLEPFAFAFLLGSLGYVAARRNLERDRQLGEIEQELELARRIQLSILPGAFPDSKHFRVAARYVPMTSVAGDLYDFLVADDTQAGLLIADVSGHGVPAALIASMVKMAATSQRDHAAEPALLLSGMNDALCGNTQGQFVTAAYVHLDAETRELRYAAAGHPAMLLLRAGQVSEIAENGMLLAALAGADFSQRTLSIVPGDRLLLYTDGLVEARDAAGTLYGDEALADALRQTAAMSPADAADRIIAAVQAWSRSQDDDLTLLVCDFVGG